MTGAYVDVVVLHVDQGMGTLVKIYEEIMDDTVLTRLSPTLRIKASGEVTLFYELTPRSPSGQRRNGDV